MVANKIQPREDDRGASMMEFALILPVVMLLIAGLVDIGFKINRVKTISTAARHAARVAASHSKLLSAQPPCGAPIAQSCSESGGPVPIAGTSINEVARDAACGYLVSAGHTPENWRVVVDPPRAIKEDGPGENPSETTTFQVTSVTVERVGDYCLVCFDRIFKAFQARSTSSFVLEGGCI